MSDERKAHKVERCAHGKTVDEECGECERVLEESGLLDLLDSMTDDMIRLPDEGETSGQ